MTRPASRRQRASPPGNATPLAWLGHDLRSAGVLATARRLLQIRQDLAAALPAPMRDVCQIAGMENQRVILAVPSAAYAAKLRQLAPRLAQALTARGWNLNEIAVRVQAGLPGPGTISSRPPREAVPLDAGALDAFQALHAQLEPGPLADAVARLLAHHGRTN